MLVIGLVGSMLAASCSTLEDQFGGEDAAETTEPTLGGEAADNNPSESSATSTAGSDAADEDTEAEAVRPTIWRRADDSELQPERPISSFGDAVAPAGDQGWTIVGSILDYETDTHRPAVWETESLERFGEWTRTDLAQAADASSRMTGMVRTESLDVAVGSNGRDREQRPAVWVRSTDDWVVAEPAQFDSGARGWFDLVAASPDGESILAVGKQVNEDNKRNPALWLSEDGMDWEPVQGTPFATDGSDRIDGAAFGPDVSVLTGWRVTDSDETAAAYWSDDQRTWNEADIEVPAGATDSYLGEVEWFDDRFVAVGGVADDQIYRPAAWTSLDGQAWELQQRPFDMNDDGRSSTRGIGADKLTSAGDALYATSWNSFMQQLWTSTDGVTWTTVDNIWDLRNDGVAVSSIAAEGDYVLLPTGEPSMIINEKGRGFRETASGLDLVPQPSESPYVHDIVHTGNGWVAVGGASVQAARGGVSQQALSWESTDGESWEAVDLLPNRTFGPMNSVTSSDGGVVAVGSETTKHAADRRVLGRGLVWESSSTGWDETSPAAVENADHRVTMHSVTMAGDALIAGGWIYGSDNLDVLLVDTGSTDTLQPVDVGYQGSDNEEIAALCGTDSGEAVALVHLGLRDGGTRWAPLKRSATGDWSNADVAEGALDNVDNGIGGCAFGIDGFVAAGWVSTDSNQDVGLWRSADGSSWERVPGPPQFSTEANQWVSSMVATEAGYLLAGNDTSSGEVLPVLWVGSGDDWQQIVVGDDTIDMTSLNVGFANGQIVVSGRKNGAERVYITTLDELMTELFAASDL